MSNTIFGFDLSKTPFQISLGHGWSCGCTRVPYDDVALLSFDIGVARMPFLVYHGDKSGWSLALPKSEVMKNNLLPVI
jgi:hypothetical protein